MSAPCWQEIYIVLVSSSEPPAIRSLLHMQMSSSNTIEIKLWAHDIKVSRLIMTSSILLTRSCHSK